MTYNNFQQGHRCPCCAGNKNFTYEEVKKQIESRGHRLLSTEYKNTHAKLRVECSRGHQFKVRHYSFLQGYGCPQCNESKGEKKLGKALRSIFPMENIRAQDNLVFLGRQKVDFSIRNLKLAFEYDGEQHFRPVDYGCLSEKRAKENFKQAQERDKRKGKLCQEKGYVLIRFPYTKEVNIDNVKDVIEETNGRCSTHSFGRTTNHS